MYNSYVSNAIAYNYSDQLRNFKWFTKNKRFCTCTNIVRWIYLWHNCEYINESDPFLMHN